MSDDPELHAMNEVYKALKELDDDGKARVIGWIAARFSLKAAKKPQDAVADPKPATGSDAPKKLAGFTAVADCFAAAKPQSTADKALVVAAYLQETNGGDDISGREINKELTHMGHGVQNITMAVLPLINAQPQLLIQTRKEGKTKQAQKKYRVTNEGFTRVTALLAGSPAGELSE